MTWDTYWALHYLLEFLFEGLKMRWNHSGAKFWRLIPGILVICVLPYWRILHFGLLACGGSSRNYKRRKRLRNLSSGQRLMEFSSGSCCGELWRQRDRYAVMNLFLRFLCFLILTCLLSFFLLPPFCPGDDSVYYCPGEVWLCVFLDGTSADRAMHIITHTDRFHISPQSCLALQSLHMVRHTHASSYSWRLHCCCRRQFHVCGSELYGIHYSPLFWIRLCISVCAWIIEQ